PLRESSAGDSRDHAQHPALVRTLRPARLGVFHFITFVTRHPISCYEMDLAKLFGSQQRRPAPRCVETSPVAVFLAGATSCYESGYGMPRRLAPAPTTPPRIPWRTCPVPHPSIVPHSRGTTLSFATDYPSRRCRFPREHRGSFHTPTSST